MAKAYGTRLANDRVRESIQIHGALGFARQVGESGQSVRLEEMYRGRQDPRDLRRRQRVTAVDEGRTLIGRDVTG